VPEDYSGFVEVLAGPNPQRAKLGKHEAISKRRTLVLAANRARAEEEPQGQDVIRKPL
jgi:hypothetical protein